MVAVTASPLPLQAYSAKYFPTAPGRSDEVSSTACPNNQNVFTWVFVGAKPLAIPGGHWRGSRQNSCPAIITSAHCRAGWISGTRTLCEILTPNQT